MIEREALLGEFPRLRPRLVAALARLVGATDAEDLANETLLRALSAAGDFRGDAALGTWLHRIGVNLAYDLLRRRGRQGPAVAVEPEEPAAEPGLDPIERRQMSDCVQQVLAALPAPQRQLLVQADVLDRSAPEIARAAGITTGNAKIRLHRARRALQSALETRCEFHYRDGNVLCCAPKEA